MPTYLVNLDELQDGCVIASLEFTVEFPAYSRAPVSLPTPGTTVSVQSEHGLVHLAVVEEIVSQITFRVRLTT